MRKAYLMNENKKYFLNSLRSASGTERAGDSRGVWGASPPRRGSAPDKKLLPGLAGIRQHSPFSSEAKQ